LLFASFSLYNLGWLLATTWNEKLGKVKEFDIGQRKVRKLKKSRKLWFACDVLMQLP